MEIKELIAKMSLEEKVSFLSGKNFSESTDSVKYGIPSMFMCDGPHGVRRQEKCDHLGMNQSLKATCFPTAATMANSWDPELEYRMGAALGEEAAEQKLHMLMGPGLNIKRNPLCGRNFEYFSEDPYLAGKMASAHVRGVQSRGIGACIKHFAANNQEERRMCIDTIIDERALREIYLTGFEIALKESGVKMVMSAYNKLNGVYANENIHLLKEILRDEWGFNGVVVTDWGANHIRVEGLKAGNEIEMPGNAGETDAEVLEAARAGVIDESLIDEALERLFRISFETDEALHTERESFNVEEHHKIALQSAEGSIVLLKNENNILPLKGNIKIAVIGDFAKYPKYQGCGSSLVNSTKVDNTVDIIGEYGLNVIGYEAGFNRYGKRNKELIKNAVALAKKADVILLYAGLDDAAETEGLDRKNMKLPVNQLELIAALKGTGVKIITVLACGSAVELDWTDGTEALVHSCLGGQAVARAVLNVLTGKVNPSGKLSESFPYKYEDCSSASHFPAWQKSVEYRESLYIGYRYYDSANVPVRFPFGYGLSYTQFEYGGLNITGEGVSFNITNTGEVAGAEIAQMYIGAKDGKVFRPKKELKGFAKIALNPGETKKVSIAFDDKTFRYFNVKTNKWEIEPCEYEIMIGASSADIRLNGIIAKEGTVALNPYDSSELPSYYSGAAADVPLDEFERLLGKLLPSPNYDFIKKNRIVVDCNTAVMELRYARGWVGRLFPKAIKLAYNFLRAIGKRKTANVLMLGVYNVPLRGLSRMSGGMISWGQMNGLITMFNGKFFKGFGIFLKEGRRKKRRIKELKRLQKEN